MQTEPNRGYPYPTDPETVNVQSWLQTQAATIGSDVEAVDTAAKNFQFKLLPTGADLNAYQTAGAVAVNSSTIAPTLLHSASDDVGVYFVTYTNANSCVQTFHPANGNTDVRWRACVADAWTKWSTIPSGTGRADTYRHDILQQQFKRRRGGKVGTGGKGAVAIRFDHGLNNFGAKVLPIMRAKNFPCSLALFSDMFNPSNYFYAENTTSSWAQVQGWALNDGVEIWNHSKTHRDALSWSAVEDETIGSLAALKAALPKCAVEGWIQPGAGGNRWFGFDDGRSLEDWTDHPAGRMILNNHAVVTGVMNGQLQPLDGKPTEATYYLDISDYNSVSTAQAQIMRAAETGSGCCVMLHPSLIDVTNQITLAQVQVFFDWLSAQRDAGLIDVMTLGSLMLADAGTTYRHNILQNSSFAEGMNYWNGSGWTFPAEGGGIYAQAGPSTTLMEQVQDLRLNTVWTGAPRRVGVKIRAAAAASWKLTVLVDSDITKVVTVTPGTAWQDLSTVIAIPSDAQYLTWRLEKISGGPVDIHTPTVSPA